MSAVSASRQPRCPLAFLTSTIREAAAPISPLFTPWGSRGSRLSSPSRSPAGSAQQIRENLLTN
ncbi:hypothetical protein PISMIDRAFT_671251 [Pisolithus microcarpus 441]|uniref:Uncharacterized protein n=1 Tax=Pisolithus microcarpus 441 TaxID=765257 RepID=A0A0C9ZVS4_9AGAM|nr:hypothetical protein PISMIDRAFT_671251 [Pisolithus microcarpus 441]